MRAGWAAPRLWRLLLGGLAVAAVPASTAAGAPAHLRATGTRVQPAVPLRTARGILPPKNPSRSLFPKPDFLSASSCVGGKDTATCNKVVLSAVKRARSLLEGLGPMAVYLPGYEKLSRIEQLFVTANLERLARGLPAAGELSLTLDKIAEIGATHNEDPPLSKLPRTLPGGAYWISAGADWASGFVNPLGSDYGWMYDDGPGSFNGDCTATYKAGCWGHRDNILGTYGRRADCAGRAFHLVMGTGYVAKDGYHQDGETELFVGVCGAMPTDTVFTWARAKQLLHLG